MLPADFLPAFLRPFTFIFPQYYGMMGYQDLMVRSGGVMQILPEAGALLLFTVIFTALAIWRFDPRD
jgi:ABC-type multidrug transport system permease subunit